MSVDNAVKGLAVLTAIPVVMLALWADYFAQGLAELAKENPHYDRATELYKIRLAGLCAIFFQFGIFMGTGPVRQESPIISNLLFVVGVLLQAVVQNSAERKLRKPTPSLKPLPISQDLNDGSPAVSAGKENELREPLQEMELALRAFIWATLGGALYLAGFALPVIVVSFVAKLLNTSPPVMTALVIVSAIGGMIGGVAINFALGSFYLRKMLPTREIVEGHLYSDLKDCFAHAGLQTPSFWTIETGRKREATAMMAGFPGGRGFFKPGLFLSRGLLDTLNAAEIRAVVMHEVSHLCLHHLRNRLLYSAALVVGTTASATFCVFLASILLPGSDLRPYIGFAAAAAAFVLTFGMLGKQSRDHESKADLYSVEKLGAGVDDLISALRKLDQVNGSAHMPLNPLSLTGGQTHPPTERRIAALRARFPEERGAGNGPTTADDQQRAA